MNTGDEQQEALKSWVPEQHCFSINANQAKLSCGFLRSLPSAWFPGLAAHWLPFQHSSGLEFQITEVRPLLTLSGLSFGPGLQPIAGWIVDEEQLVLYSSPAVSDAISSSLALDAKTIVKPILIDYLSRRLVVSLLNCWSAFEIKKLEYDSEIQLDQFQPEAFVLVSLNVNSEKISFAFGLSKGLVNRLDGLWRRQIQASRRSAFFEKYSTKNALDFNIEVARLSLSPNAIGSYLNSGNVIDLEIAMTDNAILSFQDQAWLGVKLRNMQGNFAFEVSNLNASLAQTVPGTTALIAELGQIKIPCSELVEYEQLGSIIQSNLALSNLVNLSIRGERVASAELSNYQGRWALKII